MLAAHAGEYRGLPYHAGTEYDCLFLFRETKNIVNHETRGRIESSLTGSKIHGEGTTDLHEMKPHRPPPR